MSETKKSIEQDPSYLLGEAIYIIESFTGISSKDLKPLREHDENVPMADYRARKAKDNGKAFLEKVMKQRIAVLGR